MKIIASSRLHSVRLLICLCLLAQPFAAMAQTDVLAPLPPAAQEAINKGILAAKLPDYPLAIRYFEEAREVAPEAPVIYLNMGLAESKIPGRELRAIAWFGAYLAAYSEAPNAAAVQEQIAVLEVRNRSNTSRLIKMVQDAASHDSTLVTIPSSINDKQSENLHKVADLWTAAGDITAAIKTANRIQDAKEKSNALIDIAEAQIEAGDVTGGKKTIASAQKTAELISGADKADIQRSITEAQAKSGDIAGALKTAEFMQMGREKSKAQYYIAKAQAKSDDIAGAQKTAELISDPLWKSYAHIAIANAQIEAGDVAGGQKFIASTQKTAELISGADKAHIQGEIAKAQAKSGDIAGAKRTAELIQMESVKSKALNYIAEAQAKSGDIAGAQKTADLISDTYWKAVAQTTIASTQLKAGDVPGALSSLATAQRVFAWLHLLDGETDNSLNAEPFLDLADYLKSPPKGSSNYYVEDLMGRLTPLPDSENPQMVFEKLRFTAWRIVNAQNVITGMLKQQAKQ